jgi:response regulator of citrate/malate metabolism
MKLDKKTAAALTGLDWALAEIVEKPQQKDEFTCNEFADGAGIGRNQAHNRLQRLTQSGKLTARMITVEGKRMNLYRRA